MGRQGRGCRKKEARRPGTRQHQDCHGKPMVSSQMKNKKGLGQRGTRLEAGCCLGHRGGFTRRGKWKGSSGPRTPYCLCSLLKGSFNQRPVAGYCGELKWLGRRQAGNWEGLSGHVLSARRSYERGIPDVKWGRKA